MTINALTQFGMDLTDMELTRQFAGQLPECPDGRLQIDFSGCILDYPATNTIIDAALERLERAKPPRELVVIFNIKFHERMFLKWFFFGSQRLGLDPTDATEEEIRSRVNQGLHSTGIVLHIRIMNPESQAKPHTFSYGE